MGETKKKMKECIEALELREQNTEWAYEYLKNKDKEGQFPDWLIYPKWFKKELKW